MKSVLIGVVLCLSSLHAAHAMNLVQDGSFESTVLADGTYRIFRQATLGPWTLGSNGLELRNKVVGSAYDGKVFAELDAFGGNSWISQSLSTTAGQWYELSFAYANRPAFPANSNGLGWSLDWSAGSRTGAVPQLPFNPTGEHVWKIFTTRFQATESSTLLKLSATGLSDGAGSSLDAISVMPVAAPIPEPESWALMVLGLLVLGGWQLRRRQSAQ